MSKIGIFYGSNTGYTAGVAGKLAEKLGVAATDVYDVAKAAPSQLGDYDVLLLGTSTWGAGDMQDNWEDFINGAEALCLKGKKIAVFGCGDESMTDTFNTGMGKLYDRMQKTGAEFIGGFNADGFDFAESEAYKDGQAVGLMLDEVNHPELSDGKIDAWVEEIKGQI